MTETKVGVVEKWSNPKLTQFGSVQLSVQIGAKWYGFFSKDEDELRQYITKYPVGSTVKIGFEPKGQYNNGKTIEFAGQTQLDLTSQPKADAAEKSQLQLALILKDVAKELRVTVEHIEKQIQGI